MNFIASNGKEITINPASFRDACGLKKAVMKSLMDAKVLENLDMSDLQDLDVSDIIDKLLGVLMALETSNDFERAVYDCLRECLYDGFYKITPQLFDDKPETREVYYEIIAKCCEVNLIPFFKSLASEFKARLATIPNESQTQQ